MNSTRLGDGRRGVSIILSAQHFRPIVCVVGSIYTICVSRLQLFFLAQDCCFLVHSTSKQNNSVSAQAGLTMWHFVIILVLSSQARGAVLPACGSCGYHFIVSLGDSSDPPSEWLQASGCFFEPRLPIGCLTCRALSCHNCVVTSPHTSRLAWCRTCYLRQHPPPASLRSGRRCRSPWGRLLRARIYQSRRRATCTIRGPTRWMLIRELNEWWL